MNPSPSPSPSPSPISFPMRSLLPAALGATLLFAGAAAYFFVVAGGGAMTAVLGGLSIVLAAVGLVSALNLLAHEGWAVVLGDDALELPRAPLLARRRDRIPYAEIGYVGLADAPTPASAKGGGPTEPMMFVAVGPRPTFRFVRQAALAAGTVEELARLLKARVTAVRGPGALVACSPWR